MAQPKKLWKIEIRKTCKGCGICVDFCPTEVLAMNGNLVCVVNLDKCTGCQFCDLRCPDFAIQVFPREASEAASHEASAPSSEPLAL